ncbi:hypothetical protein N7495_005775 [Penicillium taxi]|uniref:uncharacterized protein n=1 Tax=Penicillium taxi TaxID=168475 RepID=UPI002545AAB2|nr:uncharacterized protein N7495_005775 [Penicillium taxi]KAJ5894084.1 hypothetical protein N7495_005775 [Penicillium taxi]
MEEISSDLHSHPAQSSYDQRSTTVATLRAKMKKRKIPYFLFARKSELVAALEADDAKLLQE